MDPDLLLADAERGDELAGSARVEQLAVIATFDPARLAERADGADIVRLLCKPVSSPLGRPAVILRERRRIDALTRMLERGGPAELARTRAAVHPGDDGPLQRMLDAFVLGPGTPVDERDEDELMASLEVWHWATEAVARARLSGSVRIDPSRDVLEGRLALLDVTRPVRKLTEAGCVGRDAELTRLHAYLDTPPSRSRLSDDPPMVVYGIGGVGKSTLIARLVMDLYETGQRGTRRAWAYLDLDRPTIASGSPQVLLDDIYSQVAAQFPEHRGLLLRDAGVARLRGVGAGSESADAVSHRAGAADLARALESVTGGSLVVVLDTYEELERRLSPRDGGALFDLFAGLASQLPAFRLIVSGRAPAAAFTSSTRPDRRMHVRPFAAGEAAALLRFFVERDASPGRPFVDDQLAEAIIGLVGGIPLTIRLAARVLADEGPGAISEAAERARAVSRVRTEFVQGFLYHRILNHITAPDPGRTAELRQIAEASLVLRLVTPALVEEVLQPAVGYHPASPPSALFAALAAEVALAERDGDVLRLREELRGPALTALRLQDPRLVRRVHELAARFYQAATGAAAEVELAYHQLAAGQPVGPTDAGVLRRLEPFLDEFPASTAGTVRRALDQPASLTAAQATAVWEREVLAEADAAIRSGQPERVRQLLAQRTDRSADTELYRLQSRAEEELGDLRTALSAALQDVAAAEAAADPERVTAAAVRVAALHERLADPLSAREALRQAEAGALLAGYPELRLELLLNQMNTGERGGLDSEEAHWSLSLRARALLQRSDPKRLSGSSALARLLAAALGREEPERIRQAVRRIGLGHEANPLRVQAVVSALAAWDAAQPEPGRLARLAGLAASSADPTQAWAALAFTDTEAGPLLDRLWRAESFPAPVREALRELYLWWAAEPPPPADAVTVATPPAVIRGAAQPGEVVTAAPPSPATRGALALTPSGTRLLVDLITAAFPSATEQMTLVNLAGMQPSVIDWNGPSSVVAYNIIMRADAEGRLPQLIRALRDKLPSSPEVAELAALLGEPAADSRAPRGAAADVTTDPLEAAWLPNGAPLVNREQLRKGVRDLLRPDGSRVLIVNGPPGSGKSYSASFIRGVQQATGAFRFALVRYDPGSLRDYGPRELADALGDILGVRLSADATAAPYVYGRQLAAQLVAAGRADEKPWWWVLDGFSGARPELADFIARLIQAAVDEPRVRLVLLGYDQPLSREAEAVTIYEDIAPLSEADVRAYLGRLALSAREPTGEESIEESVRTIFAGLPTGRERNVALGVRVLRASGQFTR
jgi:hypothetical protein